MPDQFVGRCCKCRARLSLRRGTFLDSLKISLQTVMDIIFHWALHTRQTDQATFDDCNRATIVSLQRKLRNKYSFVKI